MDGPNGSARESTGGFPRRGIRGSETCLYDFGGVNVSGKEKTLGIRYSIRYSAPIPAYGAKISPGAANWGD